ncbi:hypothetical protein WJN01_14750 [Flavobacteriaceae bacterium SZ-1-7]|uniref:hypothetical protein n=1 Tax=Tamlana sedimenti TaxID=3134126 RepID=UPI00312456BA
MNILYIIFFGIINILIFEKLTKKISIKPKIRIGLLTTLLPLLILHFVNPFYKSLPNKLFIILIGFSLALFIFHYGSKISLWLATNTISAENKNKELFKKWNNLWVLYVPYGMISIFQVTTIIKNS